MLLPHILAIPLHHHRPMTGHPQLFEVASNPLFPWPPSSVPDDGKHTKCIITSELKKV